MTILSDLAVRSQLRANVAHFDHRPRKGPEESLLVLGKCIDQSDNASTWRRKQHLIGLEESVGDPEVLVVFIVEYVRGGEVEVGEDSRRGCVLRRPAERT